MPYHEAVSGGRRLGRYIVGDRLGDGGLGEVYLAHVEGARGFRKRVVIKQVRSELVARPEVASLLLAEAEVVARLEHGNIVQVLDYGVDEQQPYLVMEHVDGASLAELLADLRRRAAPLSVTATLFVIESVCAALAHAHAVRDAEDRPLGVVHRDVTPANILVSRDGVVKLTDFGIASLASGGRAPGAGTPGYAAPEQLAGAAVDPRADIHALGVVCTELLALCSDDTDELQAIAARARAPLPAQRYPDVTTFAAALETWRAARQVLHAPAELAACVRDLQRRRGQLADQLDEALGQRVRPPRTAAMAPRDVPRRSAVWPGLGLAAALLAGATWLASTDTTAVEVVRAPDVTTPTRDLAAAPPPTHAPIDTLATQPVPVPSVVTSSARLPARTRPREPTPVGRLWVNLVPWAEASIDGRSLGRTPITVELAPGRHHLVLVNPELGQRRSREIEIVRDTDTRITAW